MLIRLYSSEYVGDGLSQETAFRLALGDLAPGVQFDALHNHAKRRGIAAIRAPAEVHDALYADRIANPGRVEYLTPLVTQEAFRTGLQTTLQDLPLAFRARLRNRLLPEEFDVSLISLDWTLARFLRAVVQHYFVRQRRFSGNREDTVPATWSEEGVEL